MIIIKALIDWQLFNNEKNEIDLQNIYCNYIKNDFIELVEDSAINKIDFKRKIYERRCDDYNMILDFNNSTCTFDFPNGENCSFDIDSEFIKEDNKIILTYSYDQEIKKIIITLKGDNK